MKLRLLSVVALAAVMGLTSASAYGFGGKRQSDCGSPCGMTGYASPCGNPCATVTYEDRKVMVTEWVKSTEEYKYFVYEPEKKKEKVKVKEMAWKDEEYKYTAHEWVKAKEKVKVCEWKAKTEEKEVTLVSFKPVVTKQKRTVCEWVCVPVTVTCVVPPPCEPRGGLFARLCGKKKGCDSDCHSCPPPCPQVVTKTVMQRQMVTREVEVDVTTYERVETKEKRPVTTHEMVWSEKEVDVMKCQPVEKTGTRKVCHWVDVEKEVEVTHWKKVEKTGTRDVYKPTQVEKVVKVAVCTPAPVVVCSPCFTPCDPCGMSGGCGSARGGLFRGRCCR